MLAIVDERMGVELVAQPEIGGNVSVRRDQIGVVIARGLVELPAAGGLEQDGDITKAMGREPSSKEIARKMHMPVSKIKEILELVKDPIFFERNTDDDEGGGLLRFVSDDKVESPFEQAVNRDLTEKIQEALKTLSDKEERVIRMRFGIGEKHNYTLEEVGRVMQLTRERIRQIESKALKKLQHPLKSKKLKEFLN